MKQMLVINVQQCVGCKSCELACAIEHSTTQDLDTAIAEKTAPRARVTVVQGDGYTAPLQCQHCENARCIAICPKGALHRADADSPVLLDSTKCIKCSWCVLACPCGAIKLDVASHAIIKCDQCVERVQQGEPPACVEACPTGALLFQTIDPASEEQQPVSLAHQQRHSEERSASEPVAKAAGGNGEPQTPAHVACRECGQGFTTEKLLALIRERLNLTDEVLAVCPRCRGREFIEMLAACQLGTAGNQPQ